MSRKKACLRGLMVTVTIFTILVFSSLWGIVLGSHSVEDLPQGTVQLTPSIPGMGEHWANLEDMPLGPIYLVYQGEVIGIEYMYSEDMLSEVSIPTPEGVEIFNELANLGVDHQVDHFDVGYMSHGHEGFDVPHWDIHLYFISRALQILIPGEAPPQE